MQVILWTLIGYLVGSIPFSLLLGRLIAKKDIRTVGDGNPGGANALKAGGIKAGVPAILLDIGKGFLPVFLAQRFGVSAWGLVPVAMAPILGHAFPLFMGFRGGKALGATAGVWLALIGVTAFLVFAVLAVPFTIFQTNDAWSANAGMFSLLGYTVFVGDVWLLVIAALNCGLIIWTHRHNLKRYPHARTWLINLLSRRGA